LLQEYVPHDQSTDKDVVNGQKWLAIHGVEGENNVSQNVIVGNYKQFW
jgi:hypothetical protein